MQLRKWSRLMVGALVVAVSMAHAKSEGRETFELAGLTLSVPGAWNVLERHDDGGIRARPAAQPEVVFMIFPPRDIEKSAEQSLNRFATIMVGSRRVLEIRPDPMARLRTTSGVPYVYQFRSYDEGDRSSACHWFGIVSGKRVYIVALLGPSKAVEAVSADVIQSVQNARVQGASSADPAMVRNSEPSRLREDDSDPMEDTSASSPGRPSQVTDWPSPGRRKKKSSSVGFRIAYAQRVTNTGGRDGLHFARGPHAEVLVTHDGKRDVVKPPIARRISMLSKDVASDETTTVMGLGGFREDTGYEPQSFTGLYIDRTGCIFITVRDYTTRVPHDLLFAYDRVTDKLVTVVGAREAQELGGTAGYGSSAIYRPTLAGDVFVFLSQPKASLRALLLRRTGPASWTPEPLQGWEDFERYSPQDFALGAADPFGGYVFYNGGSFWRMAPGRPIVELADVDLPIPEGTRFTRPVILPSGDIWMGLAETFSITQSVTQKTPNRAELRSFVELGGTAGFLRITPDGRGGADFGMISGKEIRTALNLPGRPEQGVRVNDLVFDSSTGGLLTYDTRTSMLFTLVPRE